MQLLASVSWYFGQKVFTTGFLSRYFPAALYIVFAGLLIRYSITKNSKKSCPAELAEKIDNKRLIPVFLGIVNSVGLCPALLLILTTGATKDSVTQSWMVFLAFFAGSSIWFIPVPFAGRIRRKKVIETIGIFATGLAGTIYMIKGITIIIGGILNA